MGEQTAANLITAPKSKPWVLPLMLTLWLLATGSLFVLLETHQAEPGGSGPSGYAWPSASLIHKSPALPTIALFCHPMCPCTRATMAQFDRLASQYKGKANFTIVFLKPSSQGADWVESDTWEHAKRIPTAQVIADLDGKEINRFQAKTSGETILFDATGRQLFRGGITPSRGHEGPCVATDALGAYLEGGPMKLSTSPIFGCSLLTAPG